MAIKPTAKRDPMKTKNGNERLGPLNIAQLTALMEKTASKKHKAKIGRALEARTKTQLTRTSPKYARKAAEAQAAIAAKAAQELADAQATLDADAAEVAAAKLAAESVPEVQSEPAIPNGDGIAKEPLPVEAAPTV